jgi:NADH:ubiquinone oxidoreductase subunit F (NADH-binding)
MSALHQAAPSAALGELRLLGEKVGVDLRRHLEVHGANPTRGRSRRGHASDLVTDIEDAGLTGRGGGWFPTGRKMRAVVGAAKHNGKDAAVVVNAMEGEPAASKDATLAQYNPHLILDGAVLAAEAVGAKTITVVAHRGGRTHTALARAAAQRAAASTDAIAITVLDAPGRYVSSEESALAHFVGDGIALPVTVPPRVFESGVRRRPTLLSNAETYAHIALIARHGPHWFRRVGDPSAPGTLLVSVSGAVAKPGVLEVPTGTTIRTILGLAGGTTTSVRSFVTGGYGGSWVAAADAIDLPWTVEGLRPVGGVPGAGVLIAVPTDTCALVETARVARWMAGESAGQCGPCRFGLASVSEGLDRLATRRTSSADVRLLEQRLGIIPGRGACRHPDGVVRFAATALTVHEAEVVAHLSGQCTGTQRAPLMPIPSGVTAIPVERPGEEWR